MPKTKNKIEILSFKEALKLADGKKHLLLGNGFSIALKADIFSYKSLFEEYKKMKYVSKEVLKLFKILNTKDFELVIKILKDASSVLSVYKSNSHYVKKLKSDAESLKTVLVNLISSKHPDYPSQISDTQYSSCIDFIAPFDRIYTLNYDLLLYWVIMKAIEIKGARYDDGFRYAEEEEYVVWYPEESKNQTIYYLHGALHLFDTGPEIKKFTWINTGISLLEQIKKELSQNNFPIFVAEGSSKEKLTRIRHCDYLGRGIRSFAEIGGSLFIYGHSLSENDRHYINLITKNKVSKLFISIFNDGTKKNVMANNIIVQKANKIASIRLTKNKVRPLEIYFYDANSAKVWG